MAVLMANYSIERWTGAAWTGIQASYFLSITTELATSGNRENALAFGDESDAGMTIRGILGLYALLPTQTRIRCTFTIGASSAKAFVGIVEGRSRTIEECSIRCVGIKALVNATRAYSPLFTRRPIATATTVASVEDPTSGGYQAGPLNWLMWQAGGRPAEQDFSYPSAIFYYSFEQALIAPDYAWIAGEQGWDEALKLVQAAGGQLYQGSDGVVYYRTPLAFGDGAASVTIDLSVAGDMEEEERSGLQMQQITCSYLPRAVQAMQEVVNDSTPRLIAGNASLTIELEPKWPIASLEMASATTLKTDALRVLYFDGGAVAQGGGYTHTCTVAAQKITIAITNATSRPIVVHRIVLQGEPIGALESETLTAGSGTPQRTIDENPYIQRRSHAQRLADLTLVFYAQARPIRRITGCPYNPAIEPGDAVALTAPDWGLSAAPHFVVRAGTDDAGSSHDYDLVDVSDLPNGAAVYTVGTTSYAGQTKALVW